MESRCKSQTRLFPPLSKALQTWPPKKGSARLTAIPSRGSSHRRSTPRLKAQLRAFRDDSSADILPWHKCRNSASRNAARKAGSAPGRSSTDSERHTHKAAPQDVPSNLSRLRLPAAHRLQPTRTRDRRSQPSCIEREGGVHPINFGLVEFNELDATGCDPCCSAAVIGDTQFIARSQIELHSGFR